MAKPEACRNPFGLGPLQNAFCLLVKRDMKDPKGQTGKKGKSCLVLYTSFSFYDQPCVVQISSVILANMGLPPQAHSSQAASKSLPGAMRGCVSTCSRLAGHPA